ncbi:MAG: two-component system response regulator [Haliea sp.]|uniref:response regulator n=1 Tax=Haliea sp. TaxID=1932666 RepID=UPI000C61A356|nr:response regulator [Haliea sp.]MBM68681.1 two-component system response regulator [Haliea sp.]|tara:strand:+ start:162 stop:536 length:375 start_codon:yes stop_codon:yes gene_type:complete
MAEQATILLVEDNAINCEMLARRLTRAGFRVVTAADGEQALRLMASEAPALVLMDMNLPVLDGWSACRAARQDPRLKGIPIIALTAHAMETDRQSALAAGCDDYATKPIDFPGLLAKIQRLLPA